ncbi:amino acid adenylation domain-containing protein [Streptomyces sp. TRM 70351]|uniref:amino acid adenylation domain-containing protein n=1 Tax=Streptomyces sp. TRM 70351 TaxID=3116552 RepID=UPI002E7C0B5F|nr:amino acid adenylation domain-containing protein [Streptomyces sp. TRM 70351]MEE1929017.1 amino acid adenylation domain-containing protein [Streptomyces sp. TRM 70351]
MTSRTARPALPDGQPFAAPPNRPRDPAVRVAGRTVSHGELHTRAGELARAVSPGEVVAVAGRDRYHHLVALLAVLRAGGVCLPLDAGAPKARTEVLLADSGATQVIRDGRPERLAAAPAAPGHPDAGGYLLYTSGTTGRSKGVLVRGAALRAHLAAAAERFGLTAADVVLQHARPGVDVAIEQALTALTAGACLVLPGRPLLDATALLDLLDAERVTVANLSAGHLHEITTVLPRLGRRPDTLRLMISGSDRLHPGTAAAWHRHTGVPLLNAYGPTETVITATVHTVDPEAAVTAADVAAGATVPIGTALGDRAVRVLDERLRHCPPGTAGELYLGGPLLAAGYWGDPARTAHRFVADPYAATPGARLYRTGDRVRQHPDGTVDFLGRADDQLKIRGYRVEPGEIEAALATCPGVRACAVTAHDGRLAAYVTGPAAAVPGRDAVRAHLTGLLPERLHPATLTVLDALPLTDRGKLDRRALPAPGAATVRPAAPQRTADGPRTPAEEVVAGVWSEVLGVAGIGREDDFFRLGGDSLTAVRVVGRIFEVFGAVSPYAIFEHPRLADFTAAVSGARQDERPPLTRAGRSEAPLSPLQRGLWFLDQWNPGSATYTVPWVFRFAGPVDAGALHGALRAVAVRHEALRTVFRLTEDGPRQYVRPEPDVPFHERAIPAAGLPDAIAAAVAEPFDLETGPLVRAHLLRPAAGPDGAEDREAETVLLLLFHHIVWDEGSLPVLECELAACYAALRAGRQPQLPELAVQYSDVSAWQHADPGRAERQLAYWSEQLAGAPEEPVLATDRPRPEEQRFRGACLPFSLPDPLARAVRQVAREEDATPFMVLLAGLALALHRRSGQRDLVLGSPVSTRNTAELHDLIGYFINLLPLRLRLGPELDFRGLVRHVREVCLGAYRHQEAPFDEIVSRVLADPPQDRNPLCQVLLEQHTLDERPLTMGGATVTRALHPHPVARFDLSVSVDDRGTGFTGRFEYDRDLFDAATMESLREGWLTELALGAGLPLHRLVQAAAARTPHAVALVEDAGPDREPVRTEYAALEDRASRLARVLAARGTGRGDLVAILTGRDASLVVALLAVLKTGAGYTLLDPDFPAARLAQSASDCGAALVLTGPGHRLPGPGGPEQVPLAQLSAEAAGMPPGDPGLPCGPQDLACVMFTSGSTGRPKAVAVPHRALTATYLGQDYARFGPDEVWLQCSPVSWDAFALELYGALLFGGTCVLQPGQRADPQLISELTRRHGVTQLQLSASLFNFLLEEYPQTYDGLRTAFTAGERASVTHVAKALAGYPGTVVGNGYGPVESLGFTTCRTVEPADTAGSGIPIGRPLAHKDVLVLDAELRPVPAGVTGELYAAGDGLAHGYLGRPGLTAERFTARPGGRPGERIYRTGDLGRRTAEGVLEITGRADAQVKVNGFRIEPGEIEDALTRQPGVRESAVAVRTTAGGEHRIAAYVTAAPGGVDPERVLRGLAGHLPAHLLPATCDVLAELPLNANGKTDRAALPAPRAPLTAAAEAAAPHGDDWSPAERLVAEAFAAVLDRGGLRPEDDFFRSGGNSLAAVRVAMRLSRETGTTVRPQLVFRARTIRAIAARLPEPATAPAAAPHARKADLR